MNQDKRFSSISKTLTLAGVIIVALVLVLLSIRSVILALQLAGPSEPANSSSGSDEPAAPVSVSDSTAIAPTDAQAIQEPHDFAKEFEIMRQREAVQKETMQRLRQKIQENPNAENNLTEEQIRQMEKSGALVL